MRKALVFPGQGSQIVGMSKDLCEKYTYCNDIFIQANEILDFDLSKICFEGPQEILNQSNYAQLGIFVSSVICYHAMKENKLLENVEFFAGHSLGEWTALHLSGVVDFKKTIKILQARGSFMQEACESQPGAMLAILNLEEDKVIEIASKSDCYIANFNSLSQIVLSGSPDSIDKAEKAAIDAGAKRAVKLSVAGAFHSPLMNKAAEKMNLFLKDIEFKQLNFPVISNVTGELHANNIRNLMVEQITSSVRWVSCVQKLISLKVDEIIECGPGNVLSGLIKRIDKRLSVRNINKLSDF
mgnify:CR=1 FL=1